MQTKEILTYNEVVSISDTYLLAVVSELFGLEGYEIQRILAHDGGRNVVHTCEKEGADVKILRISFLPDRSREDFLAEVEYISGKSKKNLVSFIRFFNIAHKHTR